MNNNTCPVSLATVDCIIFRPHEDEPGIICWLKDGSTYPKVFDSDAACDMAWADIEECIINSTDFMVFYNVRFCPASLKALLTSYSPERGYCLQLLFHGHTSHCFEQCYTDEAVLLQDLALLTDILGEIQDTRAGRHPPAAIQ